MCLYGSAVSPHEELAQISNLVLPAPLYNVKIQTLQAVTDPVELMKEGYIT
jgi:hypothetical protein